MNYNNISSYNDFWLTNDSICYLEDSLVQNYFLVSGNVKTKIGENKGYGSGKIQRYDGRIYMLDECASIDAYNSEFELKFYDTESKKTTDVCSIKNCDNFLVLDETVYYLQYTWTESLRNLSLKKYSADSGEHDMIEKSVLSFGVIEKNLFYVTEENNTIAVFQYDNETNSSAKRGEFEPGITNIEKFKDNVTVSYTSNYVLFSHIDYETETSAIWKFSFENNALNNVNVEGYMDKFISYDANSYFIISYDQENDSNLFKFDNETNEITQIGQIGGSGSLFVGSDDGVYVLEYEDHVLKYYSDGEEPQTIYKF